MYLYFRCYIDKGAVFVDYKQFFDQLNGKKIAMCGIGVSNTPLILKFLDMGARVFACDRRSRDLIGPVADELEAKGAELKLGSDYLKNLEVDMVFRTPGMHPNIPALKALRESGAEVTSEMEVFFELCPCTILAVTGSDGKTTTTTLIAELLKAQGHTVHLGGNIGKPLLSEAGEMKETDVAVLELSSFQLMGMAYSPMVSAITNLTPNHLCKAVYSFYGFVYGKHNCVFSSLFLRSQFQPMAACLMNIILKLLKVIFL